jgi:uncharacterized membrane protein
MKGKMLNTGAVMFMVGFVLAILGSVQPIEEGAVWPTYLSWIVGTLSIGGVILMLPVLLPVIFGKRPPKI